MKWIPLILTIVCTHIKAQVINHSYAHPDKVGYQHLHWRAKVNFQSQCIEATATYDLKPHDDHPLILDTKGLEIQQVKSDGVVVPYELGKTEDPILGRPLIIQVKYSVKQVSVTYKTTAASEALLWVEGDSPFLFTQSQAILARSWIPCQDLPALRFTYSADVEVPNGLMALMSASNAQQKWAAKKGSATVVYHFEQKRNIPSYLMALAVGNIEFAPISHRCGVYAVPDQLDVAKSELEDLEKMVVAAERLYGPYQWDRYDVLILPAAFPFGGMENPMLTFATPTILAGDKSLVSLIAHELAHSWSGNLVTNETWDDFWLNEGFTVYFEFRIMEELYGKEVSEMLAALSIQDLYQTMEELAPVDTHLKLHLKDRNPDDGMNDVAYNKGYWLLRTIEERVGRPKMDAFLKNYFTHHAFGVMNTERFLALAKKDLMDPGNYRFIAPEAWIYQPGVPENAYPIVSQKILETDDWIARCNANDEGMKQLPWKEWSYQQQYRFLTNWQCPSADKLNEFNQRFGVSKTGNSEILFAWLMMCIQMSVWDDANEQVMSHFLGSVGRRKFIAPLYKAMIKALQRDRALGYFNRYQQTYHAVTRNTIVEHLKSE